MEDPRARSQQNGAQKLRRLMLEALISKKLSEAAKYHLEKVVAKQLEDIVKDKFLELIRSFEFKKQMEDVICNLLPVFSIRSPADESYPPSAPPPPPLPPPSPTLLLQFRSEEIKPLYANRKLGEQLTSPMEVVLVDASGKVVSEGKEASASLKLLLLDADAGERGEAMTREEFKKAELKPRNNKPPLLTGKLYVKLHKGKGTVDPSVCFTDNSAWTRRRSFCLGLIPDVSESHIIGAKTGAFIVKDQRSEGNKKCDYPESSDKVWLLKGISKGGKYHTRLKERNIHTVGDFIACLESNREELKSLFKHQDFKTTEEHARKCKTNREDESLDDTCKNDLSHSNGETLLKAPNEAQPKFHGQDRASNAEMYKATQQCVQKAPDKMVSLEGLNSKDSNVIVVDGQVEGDANREGISRFGQATLGPIGELHGNRLAKSIKRPRGQINKQDRLSNPATSSHEPHQITLFSPSKMPDLNILAKDVQMVNNPQTSVCLESHDAIISISHVAGETIGCPSKSVGHWNESNAHLSMTMDPMTSSMEIGHNTSEEFQEGLYPIPMSPFPSNLGLYTGMDLDSNPPMPDTVHSFNRGNTSRTNLPSIWELEEWLPKNGLGVDLHSFSGTKELDRNLSQFE